MAKPPQVIETTGECIDEGELDPELRKSRLEFRNPPAPEPPAATRPAEGGSRAARALRARRGVKLEAAAEHAVAAEKTGARVLGVALDFMADPAQFLSEARKRRDR